MSTSKRIFSGQGPKGTKEILRDFFYNAKTGASLILADYNQRDEVESIDFEYSNNRITIIVKYRGVEKRFRPGEIIIPIFRNENKYQVEYLADGLYLKNGLKPKLIYNGKWDSRVDTPYGLIIKSSARKQIIFIFVENNQDLLNRISFASLALANKVFLTND
ncbi:MAG: hypothetical protein PHR00_03765 [Patescibacteria group bacterium]|nr:hypothetical protein [Patescibacteria group bacterium]